MVHQYRNNGYNIVLDVCSGSVHVVDDVVYDVLSGYCKAYENVCEADEDSRCADGCSSCPKELSASARDALIAKCSETYPREDVLEALEEIEELKAEGLLFAEDEYKDYIIDFKKRKTVVKALCLHIAHDCNLGCRYCFAEEGEYHGSKGEAPGRGEAGPETGRRRPHPPGCGKGAGSLWQEPGSRV